MLENSWVQVMKANALREQGMAAVFPKGLPVLLIRKTAEEIYAVANKCPHLGCTLNRGRLDGDTLWCPCHDWRFDVKSGAFLDAAEISLKIYEWKIAGGYIHVKV